MEPAAAGGRLEPRVISFRYHLITIVGIFLAIALGIVMGATFIQDPLLAQLKERTEGAEERSAEARDDVARLERRLAALEPFGEQVFPWLTDGALTDLPVVILTQDGTSSADLDAARAAVTEAGAVIEAHVSLTPKLRAADEGSREALAQLLDMAPSAEPEALMAAVSERIGLRLADGGAAVDGEPDILEALITGEFVTIRRVAPEELPTVGGAGTVLMVVAGGSGAPSIEPEQILLPVLRAYTSRGRSAVGVQASDSEYPFVTLLRTDDELAAAVSSIDHIDVMSGRIALVLAIADLARDRTVGHYGTAAERLLPSPRPSLGP
ncbi:MAG: copper transporter [Actinomycetota bacterium]